MRHNSHAVQYMTCDQSWVLSAGLTFARFRNVCKAVIKEVTSCGEGVGSGSLNWPLVAGGLPRVKVCLNVANLVVAELLGVTGRLE